MRVFYICLLITLAFPAFSQWSEEEDNRGEFWFAPVVETAVYSTSGAAFGAGFALAYGKGASVGFKTSFLFDSAENIDILELCFLFRYYLKGIGVSSGPFVQAHGGSAVFFRRGESVSMPVNWGVLNAGLNFGWRFYLGKLYFIEPAVRAGYPYLIGAGVSAGVRL
jgi:hypothetical protein